MAVYGYTRVSTGRQAEAGESLGAQQRKIEGYAMMNGMTVDAMFIERGVSGSTRVSDRPEGGKLTAMVQPGDVIITPKLDRMFRSALDALDILAKLQKAGVSLHMIDLGGDVTGNGISKLVFTILSAVAEAERDRIRERIRDVKTDQRKRNRYLGGTVPFGWVLAEDRELIEDATQQAAITRMKAMRGAGQSLREIAATLQADGFTISHAGVKRVIGAAI
jgi:putative DNA-invertase from lambdoid prophage Rac